MLPACLISATACPAIVLPAGRLKDGRPVGVQLVGKWGDDAKVLAAAATLEAALGLGMDQGSQSLSHRNLVKSRGFRLGCHASPITNVAIPSSAYSLSGGGSELHFLFMLTSARSNVMTSCACCCLRRPARRSGGAPIPNSKGDGSLQRPAGPNTPIPAPDAADRAARQQFFRQGMVPHR